MDLREMRYFVEVARNKSFTLAAQKLFITQPTLSRTIAALEDEIGHRLLDRTNHRIELTEKGLFLFNQAQSILALVQKTKLEAQSDDNLLGEITLVAGEFPAMSIVTEAIVDFQKRNPRVSIHLLSGNAEDSAARLRMGTADFGLFTLPADLDGFDSIPLPAFNRWGVLTNRESGLTGPVVTSETLRSLPLYVSRQERFRGRLSGWLGAPFGSLNIRGTYNLLWNAALVARAGGHVLCLEGIVPEDEELQFLRLEPELRLGVVLAWPEARSQKKLTESFLKTVMEHIDRAAQKVASEAAGRT